ncbi:expressed unknown protein [Ectocarpus siliculosus]|uniref:DDE Tnp4 domain-containing protein n=1 Tax=Ectocarpus siliculosus TaxID=2880 RepID=D7FRZ1_ECTSI|nr:expressed unknown protein [Ectocarpus siliculosus]|eukprot:CBJ30932.1 expressed unknown protein [Ectocarpus siliculosus]
MHAADYIDGVGRSRGRQSIPMEERFWHRVGREMPSRNFMILFRCMRPTFAALVKELYDTLDVRASDGGRGPAFHPCERTAMVLYRLGHGAGARATAALFGVSDGWVTSCTCEFITRVTARLIPRFLWSWPTRNDQDNISAAFERRTGFRGPPGSAGDAGVWDWARQSKDIAEEQKLPEAQRRHRRRPRNREAKYLADKYMEATWGAEGSALDQARLAAEASYPAQTANDEGGGSEEETGPDIDAANLAGSFIGFAGPVMCWAADHWREIASASSPYPQLYARSEADQPPEYCTVFHHMVKSAGSTVKSTLRSASRREGVPLPASRCYGRGRLGRALRRPGGCRGFWSSEVAATAANENVLHSRGELGLSKDSILKWRWHFVPPRRPSPSPRWSSW